MGFLICDMHVGSSSPGIEPGPPALGARSLNHCATREVPLSVFLKAENNACAHLFLGGSSHLTVTSRAFPKHTTEMELSGMLTIKNSPVEAQTKRQVLDVLHLLQIYLPSFTTLFRVPGGWSSPLPPAATPGPRSAAGPGWAVAVPAPKGHAFPTAISGVWWLCGHLSRGREGTSPSSIGFP